MGNRAKGKVKPLKNLKRTDLFHARQHGLNWWLTGPGIIAYDLNKGKAQRVMRALNRVLLEHFRPSRSGKYSRRKGLGFEREFARMLRPWFPKARRQLEFQKECALGVDLCETGHYRFQCKKLKDYAPVNTIKEIQCDRDLSGEVPVLITAGDNKPAMAIMYMEDFLALLPKYADSKGNK